MSLSKIFDSNTCSFRICFYYGDNLKRSSGLPSLKRCGHRWEKCFMNTYCSQPNRISCLKYVHDKHSLQVYWGELTEKINDGSGVYLFTWTMDNMDTMWPSRAATKHNLQYEPEVCVWIAKLRWLQYRQIFYSILPILILLKFILYHIFIFYGKQVNYKW